MLDVNNRALLNFNGNTVYDGMDAEIILYKVAIYLRLSRDDENIGDSGSIINQREFLTKHVENQANWELVNIYIDDGYTGTNFNRPSWLRLKRDIELGKVNLVITKDLSRLGRDYIETGYYLEKFFPTHRVRYIAVNDGIDTFSKNSNNDMSPFMSVVNDMYAKDISKKVRTAKKTKAEKGEFIGAFAPYGYKKHPNDITKLIIDDEVVWYGLPTAKWKFQVDKTTSMITVVHSMVRIKGKNTVEMIKALTDIETVVVGQNIRKLDNKKSKLVTNSFAASSGNSEDNGSILNYGLGAFVEEKEFCPKCKNHMILAKNARGTAYLKCSNKACKETKYLTVDLMNWYINSHNIKCPKRDGGELKGGLGKYGPYVRCNCGHFLKPDEI